MSAILEEVDELYREARSVLRNAYNLYSSFSVGCAVLTEKGNIFSGCNVENASYGLTLCAEANTIGSMIAYDKHERIAEILVMSASGSVCPPCGACRQIINEFASPETKVHLALSHDPYTIKTYTHAQMLPLSFTMDDTPTEEPLIIKVAPRVKRN